MSLTTLEAPQGWVCITLGEAFEWGSGGTPKSGTKEYYGGEIPWLNSGELRDQVIQDTVRTITVAGLRNSSAKWVEPGAVLVAMYGASIGKLGIAGKRLTTNQAIAFTKPDPILSKFLLYYLLSQRDQLIAHGKGGAQPNISQTIIKGFPFLMPPLPEQRRIVAAIETQLTRLDAAVAALERARANLKRYRAAVLKAACEGRLAPTEAEVARAEGRGYEPASVWLERIASPESATPLRTSHGSLPIRESACFENPEGWVQSFLGRITCLITSGSRGWAKYYNARGALFIRAQDINSDKLDLSSVALVDLPVGIEGTRTKVEQGDLLITITGANVTKSAQVTMPVSEAYVSQHVALVRPVEGIFEQYLYYWIVSPAHGRKALEKEAYGAGKPGLNLDDIRELAVAFPPLAEQHRIVAEVERRLSVVEETEGAIRASLRRAERLRQGVLRRAFAGELVGQDPTDEPASVLLARIRAERAARQIKPANRRKVAADQPKLL